MTTTPTTSKCSLIKRCLQSVVSRRGSPVVGTPNVLQPLKRTNCLVATYDTVAMRYSFSTMPQQLDSEDEWNASSSGDDPDSFFRPRLYTKETPQLQQQLTFDQFMDKIPQTIKNRQQELARNPRAYQFVDDPILTLFSSMKLEKHDWVPYAHFDPSRSYTRNLIATDDETFTLLLLCWNPDCESKIHDHPCDGCWLNVLQGQVQECRYEYPTAEVGGDQLKCIADETFAAGQLAFINDSIGLHKIGNPSKTVPAVTLHLYSPPFQECRVWMEKADSNDGSSSTPVVAKSCCASHFSEYGRVL